MSEVDLSTLPPLPPSPLLPNSISYEHLEEQPGSELHLSTLPPLPLSPPLSPSPSFEHFAHVDFKLPLDNSALEKQVIVDLTDEVKQDEIDIKDNVEDVSNGCPTEQEPSPLVEDQRLSPSDFEEGHTLVQDENASEAKNDAAVQAEVVGVVGFVGTVALVPSASLIELERPTESETKIPSSSPSPSMLGLYLSKPDLATSVAISSAKESEEMTALLDQPEETKKTPAPRYKRTRRGGRNQRRPRKAYTSNGSTSSPALNTKVPTTVAKASSSQASSSGSRKSESKGLGSKVSNRPSPHPAPALAARPSAHSSLPPKPKAARPIPKSTPSNGPPGTLSGGVKLGIPNETMNSQEKKTSGHGRGYRRSHKPQPRPSS
ncbi:hypothetical protein C8Q75DRAFT_460461 [Abortiporus biennis]|nr:hypothetical protein C8Q75DRAFT_460461 [Abortiporus biennis]